MAKFRKNYERHSGASGGGMIIRVILFVGLLAIMFWAFRWLMAQKVIENNDEGITEDIADFEAVGIDSVYFLPTTRFGEIVRHKFFALSYAEEFELAEWVAYELTSKRINVEWVKRTDDYRPDLKIKTGSSTPEDFRGSGYDRGHLVSAADMAFSAESMSETFLMSNMAPQASGFNKGVWRELEETTRDWAKKFKHLYIVSGPVLTENRTKRIGDNKVAVPESFFRIILDLREPELKAIAFIIHNKVTEKRLEEFASSVDEVEKLTGLDFFPNLMPDRLEERLESGFDTKLWKTNEKKYEIRVKHWNKN